MSWKDEFAKAAVDYIVARSTLVSESASEWGWSWADYGDDEFARDHVMECGIKAGTYEDSRWTEFDGTFADPPTSSHTGLDAIVTCECGLVENRRFRYQGSYASLIKAITS